MQPPHARRRIWAVVAVLFAAVSVLFPLLSLPAAFLLLLAALAQRSPPPGLKFILALGAVLSLGALIRFTVTEAAPGIVEGGRRAQAKSALNQLRQIVFAEDVAREQAFFDPDQDGVGSALTFSGLMGGPVRGGPPAPAPLLLRFGPLVETTGRDGQPLTISSVGGYGVVLYLPGKDGRGVTTSAEGIDDEAAERRFVAYAWPLDPGPEDDNTLIFIDEHERILVSDNQGDRQRYVGESGAPRFDAALSGPTLSSTAVVAGQTGRDGGVWTPWKGKQPRARLVGGE